LFSQTTYQIIQHNYYSVKQYVISHLMEITLVMDTLQKQQNNLCFKILRLFQLLVYSDTYIYEQILNIDKTFQFTG